MDYGGSVGGAKHDDHRSFDHHQRGDDERSGSPKVGPHHGKLFTRNDKWDSRNDRWDSRSNSGDHSSDSGRPDNGKLRALLVGAEGASTLTGSHESPETISASQSSYKQPHMERFLHQLTSLRDDIVASSVSGAGWSAASENVTLHSGQTALTAEGLSASSLNASELFHFAIFDLTGTKASAHMLHPEPSATIGLSDGSQITFIDYPHAHKTNL